MERPKKKEEPRMADGALLAPGNFMFVLSQEAHLSPGEGGETGREIAFQLCAGWLG